MRKLDEKVGDDFTDAICNTNERGNLMVCNTNPGESREFAGNLQGFSDFSHKSNTNKFQSQPTLRGCNTKYNIIYADPPWTYRDKASAGKRGACFKYSVMSIDELKKLPISDMSDNDCILFLWVTMPKLDEVFSLIKEWGFEYKTVAFVWIKKNKNSSNFIGMGRWTRANAELCLLATKGNPKRIDAGISQIVENKVREHSRKPDEVRNLIVKLVGDLPRVELFARQRFEGWDAWGNEASNDMQTILDHKR